jgi:hypothetical protein
VFSGTKEVISTYCLYENLEGLKSTKSRHLICQDLYLSYRLIFYNFKMLAAGRNLEMGNMFIVSCSEINSFVFISSLQ